ncbi:glycosyltransferase family 4 protein [Proteiniphilum sp. UBA1028]|jgi:glycosyltransferase involved in cell wall biosynthesis|uniref:glycosyltransferase family 4 protein n=1 Tax=Proteiniphilum sp. UBA1028 TaxID=1947251 RepID=UPI000E899574|nr:glycosyltransferase family 4 protein [Proteiniphilum sp. UBA1028]HBG57708.1 glycosyl transferase [Porphyromonadaceae bacterium]
MKIAMLAPIAWRTPPVHYGPWELVTSLLTEELVKNGVDVTLFATANSVTKAKLQAVSPMGYDEDRSIDAKVWECLHISECFEHAGEFDIIHNQFDFLPLTYSGMVNTPVVTTIHGFSSPRIMPVYKKYNDTTHYISISDADRSPELDYTATVYHGIDLDQFTFNPEPKGDYILYFGRVHHDKGTKEAVEITRALNRRLVIAGIIQDEVYFNEYVKPFLKQGEVEYIGSVGPDKRDTLLGNATLLLHPINFREPFGLSVVEAMACGTPVVAFNKGSMPELIIDGKNGFLAENMEEAIEKIKKIDNLDRINCRVHVEKRFSKEFMAKRYMEVYKKILLE